MSSLFQNIRTKVATFKANYEEKQQAKLKFKRERILERYNKHQELEQQRLQEAIENQIYKARKEAKDDQTASTLTSGGASNTTATEGGRLWGDASEEELCVIKEAKSEIEEEKCEIE